MIPAVLLFTVLILILLEIASRRADLRNLRISFSLDTNLAEPGETVTLRYTVRNSSIFPLLRNNWFPEPSSISFDNPGFPATHFTGTKDSFTPCS